MPEAKPDRGGGPRLNARLADSLEAGALEYTEKWHQRLEARLRIRPQNVFPGSELLDGMPEVIRWIARALENGQQLDPRELQSLHDLALFWRRAGYSIEESLLHVRVLGAILHDGLRDAIVEVGDVEAVEAAVAAEQLCRSLDHVETVLVGSYRDAEGRRFRDFGATLAHEIRGHLSAARSAADVLRLVDWQTMEDAEARRQEALDAMQRSIDGASELVQTVRNLSRAKSERLEWDREPLAEVVTAVLDRVRDRAADGTTVELVDGAPDVRVPAEPVRLALHNLLENAVKYADPGKGDRWVRVHCIRDDGEGHWRIQVGDNGIGIPLDEQEQIFDRFRRGERARGEGFGLGLSIAQNAVEQFNGQVMLESEEGKGSTFSFTIPFAETEGDDAQGG